MTPASEQVRAGRERGQRAAMTASEEEIMDLWDAGASIERIVANTRHSYQQVESTVSRYAGKLRVFDTMVRAGSAALLVALRRHHPECGRGA